MWRYHHLAGEAGTGQGASIPSELVVVPDGGSNPGPLNITPRNSSRTANVSFVSAKPAPEFEKARRLAYGWAKHGSVKRRAMAQAEYSKDSASRLDETVGGVLWVLVRAYR